MNPLKERLRTIKDPPKVRLLYDVLKFGPPEIERAVLFVTNNTLVCETQEDAMNVAYGMGDRHDAVALDGTHYRGSGLISGGSKLVHCFDKLSESSLLICPYFAFKEIYCRVLLAGTKSSSTH